MLGKLIDSSNVCLASIILRVGKVVKISNLSLPGVILCVSPVIQSLDLINPSFVLSLILLINLLDVINPGLIILLSPLLQRFYLILSITAEISQLTVNNIPSVVSPALLSSCRWLLSRRLDFE